MDSEVSILINILTCFLFSILSLSAFIKLYYLYKAILLLFMFTTFAIIISSIVVTTNITIRDGIYFTVAMFSQ